MRALVSSLILISFCFSAAAQNVETLLRGSVTDKTDGSSLPGATIIVTPGGYGTVSDLNGRYSVKLLADAQMVVASYVGMVSDTFFLREAKGGTMERHFRLSGSTTQMDAVVVSATRYGQPVRESTVSMQTLSAKQIESRNTVNIKSALEQVPGLTVLDEEPQIRGGSGFSFGVGSRVSTLVDGLPLLTGDAGRTEWSFIPTESVGRVEVVQGASSVLYGSSALSGTINFLTRVPPDSLSTSIRAHLGMYRSPKRSDAKWWRGIAPYSGLSVIHGGKKGSSEFMIGGMVNYDHGFIGPPIPDTLISKDTILNDEVAERTGRIHFLFRHRKNRFTFGLSGNTMAGYNNFSLIWGNGTDRIYRAYPGSLTTNKFFYGYLDPSMAYDSEHGIRYQLRTRVFFTDNNNSNGQANQALNSMADLNATGSFRHTGVNFTAGFFMLHTQSEASLYAAGGSPRNTALNNAAYLQLDRKFFQKLILQGGLRLERFSINGDGTSGKPVFRGGLNYEPWKGTHLRASFGQGYRYPTITERFIQTSAGGFNVFPNPNVQPESSTAAEVGFRQGIKIGKWLGFLDAAFFNQRYYNTIEYIFADWEPGASGFKFVNSGNSEVEGLEVTALAEGNFSQQVAATFFATYTFINPRTRQPDAVIGVTRPEDGFIPEQLTYLNTSSDTSGLLLKYRFRQLIKYDMEFRIAKWIIGFSCRYYSFMENIDDAFYNFDLQENTSFPDGIIKYREENADGTWVTDARLGFSPNTQWSLMLVANNVANLEYSLRPMKIESPGTIAVQIIFKP